MIIALGIGDYQVRPWRGVIWSIPSIDCCGTKDGALEATGPRGMEALRQPQGQREDMAPVWYHAVPLQVDRILNTTWAACRFNQPFRQSLGRGSPENPA
ncbi:MAG TPA: hypothetical protein DEO88_11875 [Syntrophobacteraceae bacterium]|nr:hypothetical protein [Syntrophobacteraceae bacterium]